jgi:hypothetical protein
MRNALLAATRFDWSRISARHLRLTLPGRHGAKGASANRRPLHQRARHPESHPLLFLDDLRAEFERIKTNKADLRRFHQKLAALRFLDPACGRGNFLVITYRELRRIEPASLRSLRPALPAPALAQVADHRARQRAKIRVEVNP